MASEYRRLEESEFPSGRDDPEGKHDGLDRSPDDHGWQRKQGTGAKIPGVHDPSEDAESWVAETGDRRIVAMMIFSRVLFSGDGKSSLYLSKLYVENDMRGQGIGSLMLNRLVQLAKDRDYARVFWGTNPSNKSAAEFYEKLGAIEEKGVRWFYLPASMNQD